MAKMVRLQFEIPDTNFKELERLMAEAGVKTKTELLNNALTLLEWAVEQKERGRIIASVDEKDQKYQELLMPIFARVVRKRPASETACGSTA